MQSAPKRKALDIFRDVAELPTYRQATCLDEACGSNRELRCEVESLLASDAADWTGIDNPLSPNLLDLVAREAEPGQDANEIPEVFSHFRIVARIKAGGMGVVYRAEQDDPKREVAIKIMRAERCSSSLAARFAREAATLGRLRHPGIAQIYEAGKVQTARGLCPYLAMEFVRGEPLVSFAHNRKLSVSARLELMAKICEAVHYAHQSGVIHRDLKPENILVEDSADGGRPRVLDFGVARLIHPDGTPATIATESGVLIGTLAYVAPEQLAGDATTQSDVYALGVMLYELLAGSLPVDVRKDSLPRALYRIHNEAPVPLWKHGSQFRSDIARIVHRALAKEPSARYPSADALATDLRRFVRHEPILARNPSVFYVTARFARRHRATVASALVGFVLLVTAAIIAMAEGVRARAAERQWASRLEQIVEGWLVQLETRPGTLKDRDQLATAALSDARDLLARQPGNARLLNLCASAERQLSTTSHEVGDYRTSLDRRSEAFRLRQAAIVAGEASEKVQSELAIDMVLIGDVYFALGDKRSQREWFERSAVLTKQIAHDYQTPATEVRLAWAFQRLAAVDMSEGRIEEAAANANASLAITDRLLKDDVTNAPALECARMSECYLGSLAEWKGLTEQCRGHREAAFGYAERLLGRDESNRQTTLAYLHSLHAYADLCEDQAEARQLYDRGYDRATKLLQSDAQNTDAAGLAALFQLRRAADAAKADNADTARQFIAEALTLMGATSRGGSSNEWQLGEFYHEAYRILAGLDAPEAESLIDQAREQFVRLSQREDAAPEHLRRCAELLLDLGGTRPDRPDAQLALELASRALEGSEVQTTALWRTVGTAQQQLGDFKAALTSFEAARTLATDDSERDAVEGRIASIKSWSESHK